MNLTGKLRSLDDDLSLALAVVNEPLNTMVSSKPTNWGERKDVTREREPEHVRKAEDHSFELPTVQLQVCTNRTKADDAKRINLTLQYRYLFVVLATIVFAQQAFMFYYSLR